MYAVFAFGDHWPAGGWNDHDSNHETLAEAVSLAKRLLPRAENVQVVDLVGGKVVAHGFKTPTDEVVWKDGEA